MRKLYRLKGDHAPTHIFRLQHSCACAHWQRL